MQDLLSVPDVRAIAGVALVLLATTVFSLKMFGSNKFPVDGRTVLLTGGSQGMGRGLARLLASKGANVIIVARTTQKLEDAVAYIKAAAKSPSQRFHYISADLISPDENARVIAEATRWNGGAPPDVVWANAGSSAPGLFLDASVQSLRAQMDTNYWAAVWLAQATLRSWLANPSSSSTAKQKRHFIMTSSTVAFIGVAGYSPYAPAKAALRSLHDTLVSEVNLYNGTFAAQPEASRPPMIKISTVFPGTILSPGYEQENLSKHPVTKQLEKDDPKQTEDQVASAAVAGLEKGHAIIATQFLGQLMRASALGGSRRDTFFWDTFVGWLTYIAFLFVVPDMDKTVWKWGRENGASLQATR